MCEDYILGKQDKMPFDDEVVHETRPLEHVHLDLWEKARTPSWSGAVYMMLVSDGGMSMKFPLFLNNKTAATTLGAFEIWVAEAELQTGEWVMCVRIQRNESPALSGVRRGALLHARIHSVVSAS